MASFLSKRPDPGRSARRRRLLIIGLVAFVAVDIALIALALAPPDTSSSPRSSIGPVEIPSQDTSLSPEPEPPAIVPAVVPTRILTARDDLLAWRATTGPCPDSGATPERTEDAGATWSPTDATGPTGIRALQSIIIEGTAVASMVGHSPDDCSPMFVRTYVAGDNYAEYPAGLADAWFVQPLNRAVVHGPGGDRTSPCANTLALAVRDDSSLAVLCENQTIVTSADGGATWPASVPAAGVMNLAPAASGFVAAAVAQASCAGVAILSVPEGADGASAPAQTGCFPTGATLESLAGNIAVSQAPATLWLWAGDAFVRSGDGGNTWV